MKNLQEVLINQIRGSQTNSIPFDQFMNTALYFPELGYYTKKKPKIGRAGDFYTSPYVSDVFAEVICDYSLSLDHLSQSFQFCEIGAGTGKFANAWLSYMHNCIENRPEAINYTAVEQSKYHHELLKAIPYPLFLTSDIQFLTPFKGIVFANEWLDALPVKVITKHNGMLKEVVVREESGKLLEALEPVVDPQILPYLNDYHCEPKEGYKIEVPIHLDEIVRILSQKLISGRLIFIDYMYPITEWAQPELKDGSLRGYKDHQMKRNVLETPGEMDITYHIPIEPLISLAESHGFSLIDSLRQDQFLLQNEILNKLKEHSALDPFDPVVKRNRAIQSLISPSGISPYFHVLVFEK